MLLETLTKALADQTRLRIVTLVIGKGELCVCELTQTLQLAQPKISRHLAILRESGVLLDRKIGLWVYYRLHPELPTWVQDVLTNLKTGSQTESIYQDDQIRLQNAEKLNSNCITCDDSCSST